MEPHDKKLLEEKIREKINELTATAKRYKQLIAPVSPDSSIGRLTRMDALNSRSMHEAALRKTEHTLAALKTALKELPSPDYGICEECDEPIRIGRLMILPEAKLCVRCLEKLAG